MKKISFAFFVIFLVLFIVSCASNRKGISEDPSPANITTVTKTTASSEHEDAVAFYIQGAKLLDEGKYEEAEQFFWEAVAIDEDYIDALDYLGIVLRRLGKTNEAISVLKKSIERDSINPVPYNSLIMAYLDKGDFRNALKICDDAIENIPYSGDGFYHKGAVLMKQKKYKDAITNLETALDMYKGTDESQYDETLFSLGYCYYNMKKWDEAIGYFEKAQKAFPDDETLQMLIDDAMKSR